MGNASLFEITREHLEIMALIESNEGLIDEEISNALKINRDNLESKSLNYVKIIKHCESEIQRAKEAEKQIQEFVKRKSNIATRVKENLEQAIGLFGPIETGFYKLSLRKSDQVIIENESVIPEEYLSTKIISVPEKLKIKSSLKDNKDVPGTYLMTKYNLQIK